jgi:uncharacterized protein YxjI
MALANWADIWGDIWADIWEIEGGGGAAVIVRRNVWHWSRTYTG